MTQSQRVNSFFQEISAGIVAASLTLPLCIGAGILAYAPLGSDYTAYGAVAGVSCAIIGGIISALFRQSSFVVTFPTTPICVIQASFVLSLLTASAGDRLHTIVALMLCVALSGFWQALFAISGFSKVIRFVPHTVMAGFVSGVATLIAWHQVPSILGVHSFAEVIKSGQYLPHPVVTLFGIVLFLTILLLGHFLPRVPNMLLGLLIGSAAFHAIRTFLPAVDIGATIGVLPGREMDLLSHFDVDTLKTVFASPDILKVVFFGSLTLALVGTLDTFFALRSAQFVADVPIDPRRDVLGQAIGNLASALVGGLAVSTSLSVSMANYKAGGRTRLSTVASGVTLLLGGVLFPSIIELLPLIVVAAILMAVAFRLADRWSFHVLRQAFAAKESLLLKRARKDGAIILAVFFATIFGKPVTGVAVGIGISCILFMIDMSNPVIARHRDGVSIRSKRIRPRSEQDFLCSAGLSIVVLDLRGVLFFGNAHGLAKDLRDIGDDVEIVILDCRRLTDIDSSGVTTLGQMLTCFRNRNKKLLISGANPAWLDGFTSVETGGADYLFSYLDDALEWAEDHIIRTCGSKGMHTESEFDNREVFSSTSFAEAADFIENLRIAHYPAGAFLCREGDTGDRMWILKSGSVSIRTAGTPTGLLLARMGPGSSVGEMALLDHQPRSADVCADDDVDAYILTSDEFTTILNNKPDLGKNILIFITGQLVYRLREMNQMC